MGLLSKILTAGEGKQMKEYQAKVARINSLEPAYQILTDQELMDKTAQFRQRLENGEPMENMLPEAFATVREASKRALGKRHYDVQLIGGMVLNEGRIAEMRTGEGKTLVSSTAGYLNALGGNNCHIVTVNDYLAKRDSELMGPLYRFLGMEVGIIQNGMRGPEKVKAYQADVTYGTNSEFGFDYLRDNMVSTAQNRVQRGHHFCVVDEVDSILIDEARTPLIISGPGSQAADLYAKFARVMPRLKLDEDFEMDEAKKTINATEVGLERIEAALDIDDIYADPSGMLANHLQQALKAQFLFHRDVDYVVADGEVKIVDEFTGRIMEGRRWSEGLHQAIEAKEHVLVKEENQTLATITLQNYFRLYNKLSGMTGTAMTEDAEFREIYKLQVVAIPTNKPVVRKDQDDLVYRTIDAKFNAVADEIERRHNEGQPCLIGTVSIESSERLSRLLDKRGIAHDTLNAKNHEREARIVAQAGRVGAVTIATNMAGRGTDILLGGNPDVLMEDILTSAGYDPHLEPGDEYEEGGLRPPSVEVRNKALATCEQTCKQEHEQVIAAGGLCVIGTERHESRRIDNQLRGRSGRQGDPGVTQFYLSLEDDLMRLFGGNKMDSIASMMEKSGLDESMPIQAGMVSKAIENAQHQVESMHFAARKNVLEYDDVMNLQRAAIYEERNAILDGKDMSERIEDIIADCVEAAVLENADEKSASDDWDCHAIDVWVQNMTGNMEFTIDNLHHQDDVYILIELLCEYLFSCYEKKKEQLTEPIAKALESQIMLRIIDTRWMAHLQEMDYLKTGIGLRAYGQRDPLVEYKNEAYGAFKELTAGMYEDFIRTLLRLQVAIEPAAMPEVKNPLEGKVKYSNPQATLDNGGNEGARAVRTHIAQQAEMQAYAEAQATGQPVKSPRHAAAGGPKHAKPETYQKDKDDPYANVGRNDPCPCGSGLKYKKCHGR